MMVIHQFLVIFLEGHIIQGFGSDVGDHYYEMGGWLEMGGCLTLLPNRVGFKGTANCQVVFVKLCPSICFFRADPKF